MSPEQIEDLAFRGESLPDGLDMAEQILFLALRWLYQYARLIHMDRERGRREKQAILKEFETRKRQIYWMEKTNRMWTAIELTGSAFGRERTVEAAEDFFRAVYGAGLKERREAHDHDR